MKMTGFLSERRKTNLSKNMEQWSYEEAFKQCFKIIILCYNIIVGKVTLAILARLQAK